VSDDSNLPENTRTVQSEALQEGWTEKPVRRACLTVIRGRGSDLGMHIVVNGPVVLGRDAVCDLSFKDLGVSRRHARVTPQANDIYLLEDLGSTNGTRVDGRPVEAPWPLREGEKIFLGKFAVLRFSLVDEMDVCFQQEVVQLVSTDPLTGLESKRVFDDALDVALTSARQRGARLTLLMMDMDRVKPINDTHGHLFGAYCIQSAGRLIGRVVGSAGHACRFGGDEFSAFLPGLNKEAAMEVAEQIRVSVENAGMEKDGIPLNPTISIGVAVFPEDGDEVLDLVAAADQALYRAKGAGKNRVSD
jgi:diguanylate cyclase (GGDEF)-like protein